MCDRQDARLTGASRCSSSSSHGSAGLVAAVMAVTIGEGAEGAVMFTIGKSRRVFYVFLKAPIANHSDPNPLK